MNLAKWDQRICRADELASDASVRRRRAALLSACRDAPKRFVLVFEGILRGRSRFARCRNFPRLFLKSRPARPSRSHNRPANGRTQPTDRSHALAPVAWRSASPVRRSGTLLAWLFLQPYAEYLAERTKPAARIRLRRCARSARGTRGRRAASGRGRREAFAGLRHVLHRVALRADHFVRRAANRRVEKLAIYTADQFAHVRVEACDTCGGYIKTVDLTKNGRAVPIVDELATIPLNLWAREHHYVKVHANLLGI